MTGGIATDLYIKVKKRKVAKQRVCRWFTSNELEGFGLLAIRCCFF